MSKYWYFIEDPPARNFATGNNLAVVVILKSHTNMNRTVFKCEFKFTEQIT